MLGRSAISRDEQVARLCIWIGITSAMLVLAMAFTVGMVNGFMNCNDLENYWSPTTEQWVQRQGDCWLIPTVQIHQ